MKYILSVMFLVVTVSGYCQQKTSMEELAPYLKNKNIPSFNLYVKDSVLFTEKNLPKDSAIAIIFFSPDCSHCQAEAQKLMDSAEHYKNIFFLWTSYNSIKSIYEFGNKYKITDAPNMTLGRDNVYFFITHYKISTTPFMALYDKNHRFVKEYRNYFMPTQLANFCQENTTK